MTGAFGDHAARRPHPRAVAMTRRKPIWLVYEPDDGRPESQPNVVRFSEHEIRPCPGGFGHQPDPATCTGTRVVCTAGPRRVARMEIPSMDLNRWLRAQTAFLGARLEATRVLRRTLRPPGESRSDP